MKYASPLRRIALAAVLSATLLGSAQPAAAMQRNAIGLGGAIGLSAPAAAAATELELTLLDRTNQGRILNGLEPLELDPELLGIARERAASQLGTESLTHYQGDTLAFASLLDNAGLNYTLAGENLARAPRADVATVDRVAQALMDSPTHRQNILEPSFNRLAIGAAVDPNTGRIAFAQIFRAVQ